MMTNKKDDQQKKTESGNANPEEKLLEPATPLIEELKKCEAERSEYLNGWKRAKADLINYQNEEARRLRGVLEAAETGLIKDLIPILESFALGVESLKKRGVPDQGIAIVASQFEEMLTRRGVKEIRAGKGEKFNPEFHEAVGECDSDASPETIAEEVSRGYVINGKVIKAARVMISKQKPS